MHVVGTLRPNLAPTDNSTARAARGGKGFRRTGTTGVSPGPCWPHRRRKQPIDTAEVVGGALVTLHRPLVGTARQPASAAAALLTPTGRHAPWPGSGGPRPHRGLIEGARPPWRAGWGGRLGLLGLTGWSRSTGSGAGGGAGSVVMSRARTSRRNVIRVVAAARGSRDHSRAASRRACRMAGSGWSRRSARTALVSQVDGGRAARMAAASRTAVSGRQVGEAFGDEVVAEGPRCGQGRVECLGPAAGEDVGGVGAVGDRGDLWVESVRGEQPVVAFGGETAGEVAVSGDDQVVGAGQAGQLPGLFVR